MYDRTDAILFKFLEQYFRRLEGPLAIQVWSRYIQLVRDITGTSRDFKASHFPALRFVTLFTLGPHASVLVQMLRSACREDYSNYNDGRSKTP